MEARLAGALERNGEIRQTDLARAQAAARAADKRLDEALIDLGILTEARLVEMLSGVFDVADVSAPELPGAPVLAEQLQPAYLASAQVLPLVATDAALTLAMVSPYDDFAANAIALRTNRVVTRRRIGKAQFDRVFAQLYGKSGEAPGALEDRAGADVDIADVETLRDSASDAPVIRFVQETIRAAVTGGASDIHLKPLRSGAEMQFRIDGTLRRQTPPDARLLPGILSRLKILANLDISERRLPQDGRIRANVAGQAVDIRLSTMPHIHGEAAVLRILSREVAISTLGELGFSQQVQDGLERLFGATEGLVLVTGPTGSGKSTTLHAALRRLIRPDLNVVTIEDPVEYRIDGAAQVQVDEKIGLTFPRILRSLLRQDPDIILVGEIRDAETAKIAVQAALTGHLVLATLHTNSATAAVPRLVDMGVEAYLLAAVLRGVLAQRLVRRLCPECSVPAAGPHGGDHGDGDWRRVGPACESCSGSGYAGRVALGELVLLDARTTEALARSNQLSEELQARLAAGGFVPLREDGLARARGGEISLEDLAGMLNAPG